MPEPIATVVPIDATGHAIPDQRNISAIKEQVYERYLSLDEIRGIPVGMYPLMVFSDNIRGLFSLGVKIRTHGSYGHFMWLVAPDTLASQWLYYRLFTLDHFEGSTMKLVYNPNWTDKEREILTSAILFDLKKPWYRTLYDVPGILGELLGLDWINMTCLNFCSERGRHIKLVDPEFDLRSPTPAQLNSWTKARPDRYKVFGRYTPD